MNETPSRLCFLATLAALFLLTTGCMQRKPGVDGPLADSGHATVTHDVGEIDAGPPKKKWAVSAGGVAAGSLDWADARCIAVDSVGNSFVAGSFAGAVGFGTINLTPPEGGSDLFVAKLDNAGNWVWVVTAQGTDVLTRSIAVDLAGNIFITGYFSTASFGADTLTSKGGENLFVAKMNSAGSWLWATSAEGSIPVGIAVDKAGHSYITGYIGKTAGFGANTLTSKGSHDVFVAKLDSTGTWQWAVSAGGNSTDKGLGIAVDSLGNSFITGSFDSFTANFGATPLSSKGFLDVFVAKLDSTGSWQWATSAGGNKDDQAHGIAVDSLGNSFITGYFNVTASFGATPLTSNGYFDLFVAKLNSAGSWQWATSGGGGKHDKGIGIATDSENNCALVGISNSTTANFGTSVQSLNGFLPVFVAKLDSGGIWRWVSSAMANNAYGIAMDSAGSSFIVGSYSNKASFGPTTLISKGWFDLFVAKMDKSGTW